MTLFNVYKSKLDVEKTKTVVESSATPTLVFVVFAVCVTVPFVSTNTESFAVKSVNPEALPCRTTGTLPDAVLCAKPIKPFKDSALVTGAILPSVLSLTGVP